MAVAYKTKSDERAIAVAATVAVHAVALFAILSLRAFVTPEPKDEAMTAFDIAQPPPELVTPPPPREAPPAAPVRDQNRSMPAPAPKAPRRDVLGAPAPQTPDLTPSITMPAFSPLPSFADGAGTSGPASGVGTGGGDGGNGSGGNGAGGTGGGSAKYLNAEWIRRPTPEEWHAVWPRTALREKRGGKVVLSCLVRPNGQPKRCDVEQEEPKGAGFGRAAVVLSIKFRVRPIIRNGERLDLPVRIPLVFAHKDALPDGVTLAPP